MLESGQEDAKKTIEEQRSLIEQLETDLVNVQSFLPVRTEGEVCFKVVVCCKIVQFNCI